MRYIYFRENRDSICKMDFKFIMYKTQNKLIYFRID